MGISKDSIVPNIDICLDVDSRSGSILVFYDQMDHDNFLEFPYVYWSTMLDLWKEEKYKFWEIFLLRRSHIWRLFLVLEIHDTSLKKSRILKIHMEMIMIMKFLFRPCLRDCQLQRWICLQCWKLPLHRMHVQVKNKIENTK